MNYIINQSQSRKKVTWITKPTRWHSIMSWLSDKPLNTDSETAIETLDMLDDEEIDLFKSVDVDNEYQGLEYYNTELNKED